MNSSPESADPALLTRREALKQAAFFLGVALSPSIVAGVLRAQAAPAAGRRYLDARQFPTVAAAAERILPKTDTPGAIDVGVPAFIDLMYGEYLTGDERFLFATGVKDIEAAARARHGQAFTALAAAAQDDVLRSIALASQGKDKTFFALLRELTVTGYFTAETVGRNVLHYDPVPGRWDACIPISEVGNRNWTR
ncbi:MAG: gluconate 2-dehydrogenase subunit 3 family protein [Opitutaceae bacterium]|nr:gluconate 2-dehydrogenase subunit 3 family protein [Opitutaceae bacterium]